MEKIKIMLDDGAFVPTRAHPTDAGLDLYAVEDAYIYHRSSREFDTGVHIAIPAGYMGLVISKSGLNFKHGLQCEGVIDPDYRGSIRIKLYSHDDKGMQIYRGQKIGQLVIMPIVTPEPDLVDSLDDTERGSGGFGSTGAMYEDVRP